MEIGTNELELLLCKNYYHTKRVACVRRKHFDSILFLFWFFVGSIEFQSPKFAIGAWKLLLDFKNKSFNMTERRCSATNNAYRIFVTLSKCPSVCMKEKWWVAVLYWIRLLKICEIRGEFAPWKRYRTHSDIVWLRRRHTPKW